MRKDCVARELTREIIVGAFMVMILLGLGYFTIILSRETWFTKKQHMDVLFKNVMGLREGNNVVVRGMPVGKIDYLVLDDPWVRVGLVLDDKLAMKKDYVIQIVATSILGGRYLELDEGSEGLPTLPMSSRFVGHEPYDLMADAAAVINKARTELVEGGAIDNLKKVSEQLSTMVDRIAAGKGSLGLLLSEDTGLYEDVAGSVAALRDVAERLQRGDGTLGHLMSEDDQLYTDLAAAVASLKQVAATLEKGEGSLGKLIRDDGVYTEVEGMMQEARAALDDMRETSPVVTFTSVFFGAF
ncbi:MAG: MCE family protein [Verrucomicrobia bacterium]|jgi:phospholipid/cholesterol/gamma-HCH transport system substrate-binding protein|nr:MCE family protein [Verrucomicrobiota bacterium]MBT7065391.1 MCE family protein [Verrucomicrobiota bacterium]MBT7699211.1 MCE family protein [Verrucomicrobiota bacterium]